MKDLRWRDHSELLQLGPQVRLGGRNVSVGLRGTTLLALKMEEGPDTQECRWSPEARKGKGMDLP